MAFRAAEGVLLIAHGTVVELDQLEGFLTAIRRGRPAPHTLVEEMRHRYRAIGGSPLLEVTRAQARLLSDRLALPVLPGMRFGAPSLGEALQEAESLGLRRLYLLPAAPYSVRLYCSEARAALSRLDSQRQRPGLELVAVEPWGDHPRLIEAHAAAIERAAGKALAAGAPLILSVHSLPLAVIAGGDDYQREVERSAELIARRLGVPYTLAYQSQGADGQEWLGPSVQSVLGTVSERSRSQVVLAPIGFLTEHVETLYDLDVQAKAQAASLGLELLRVPALGTDARLLDAMADVIFATSDVGA